MTVARRSPATVRVSDWLSIDRGSSVGLRVFCFSPAGAGSGTFAGWDTWWPEHLGLYAVRLPGREARWRDPPFTRLTPLVETLADVLEALLDRPFACLGHSMGALVSYELARELRRRDSPQPVRLFVSGHRAPQLPDRHAPIHGLSQPRLAGALQTMWDVPPAAFADGELAALTLPVFRADFELCETYRYVSDEPLDVAVSAFGGSADPRVRLDEVAAWRFQTTSSFRMRATPGGHRFDDAVKRLVASAVPEDLESELGACA